MKRFFALTIVFLGLIGLTQIAYAGAERMDKNVVPAPAPCDWSGFYIGMNVGVAGLTANLTDLDYAYSGDTHVLENTNFMGGGQIGYNWQKGAFVFGLEADADYLNTEESYLVDTYYYHRAKVDFQGSLRARAGVTVDKALIYATGGVALSHGSDEFRYIEEAGTATQDDWQAGFVGGMGVEYMLNCHWSARMEALYSHYPESRNDFVDHPGYRYEFQNDVYSVRFGINYLFGGGH
jgi:outer membrane immunogenic protein